jgi:surface protein
LKSLPLKVSFALYKYKGNMSMKNFLLLIVLIFTSQSIFAQNEFITTWKTDNSGSSDDTEITIPTNSSYTYNYDVDWDNDGVFDTFGVTGDITHDFGAAGTVTIRIQGEFPAIYFNGSGDKMKILSVDQWGTIGWMSMENAFNGCENLAVISDDVPDLSSVTSMEAMFKNAVYFNSDISSWDVSNVTNMADMFNGAVFFNKDISSWDVQNVIDMSAMFYHDFSFVQDISEWNVSKVADMSYMFCEAYGFNEDISGWDVSSVTNMQNMFAGASSFDINLGSWNIVSLTDASNMLDGTPLSVNNYDAILTGWGRQTVQTNVNFGASGLNYCNSEYYHDKLISTYGWTITDDGQSCSGSEYFITTWKTDNSGTSGTTEITIPTKSSYTYSYSVDWDNDGVFDEFGITGDITHDFGIADTVTIRIQGMFPAIYFNNGGDKEKLLSVDQWGTISWLSMGTAFWGCSNMDVLAVDVPDLSLVTAMTNMFKNALSFNGNISNWDVSSVTNMNSLFEGASSFNQNLNSWDVSNVISMTSLFESASSFDGDVSDWDVSSVGTMRSMFKNAYEFNQDLSSWDVSNVNNMEYMFEKAYLFEQELSGWDVSNVTSMSYMFHNASVFNGNISSWDVSNVESFAGMFQYAVEFDQDISTWDVGKVVNMNKMFYSASKFNQDISGWDVSKVTAAKEMFRNAALFDMNLGGWDVDSLLDATNMFTGAQLSVDNYDALLIGWGAQNVQDNLVFSGGYSQYCSGGNYRDTLVVKYGWTITDGGLETNAPVPDASSLPNIIAECEVTNLTEPTATDCAGTILGTHDISLPITVQGTTVVTWTYNDGNGNTSTQIQNVIIDDVTAPVADESTLNEITAECEVTELTAPTATDNCAGTITGTHDVALPIISSTSITWTFEDGNGNTSTQTQNVIIEDVTNPELTCISNQEVNVANDIYVVQGSEFDPENLSDNCQIASALNDFTNTETLAGAELPIGTNTITWTITDIAGNTASCTFQVVVSKATGIESLSEQDIMAYPNPAKDYIFIRGLDDGDIHSTTVNVFNVNGKMVYQKDLNQDYKINITGLEPGTYFIQIQKSNEIKTLRFIKPEK